MMPGSVRGMPVRSLPRLALADVRRLAVHAQGLESTPADAVSSADEDAARIAAVVARIGCLQLDPVPTVARSPLLVLHARLGVFDAAALSLAAYRDRSLFEYWCHEASLCAADDLALHRAEMRRWLHRSSPRARRARAFLEANGPFARSVVRRLRSEGPLPAAAFEDRSAQPWQHGWWTDDVSARQTVARMLDILWMTGRIGVADRGPDPTRPGARRWDLMERCLPREAPRAPRGGAAGVTRAAALRAVRMLGVARATDVRVHFTRRRYDELPAVLARLAGPRGPLREVRVDGDDGSGLRGPWYAHREDLDRLPTLEPGRAELALSPFDNLLCDRGRTALVWGFDHRLEIYTPASERRWGYYVLPVLVGERLVARADAAIDRDAGVLHVHTLHRERGVGWTPELAGSVDAALARLAAWRDATDVAVARVA
jgi:uncharacterized protein YcaQ